MAIRVTYRQERRIRVWWIDETLRSKLELSFQNPKKIIFEKIYFLCPKLWVRDREKKN
jgi:hypothetical protein